LRTAVEEKDAKIAELTKQLNHESEKARKLGAQLQEIIKDRQRIRKQTAWRKLGFMPWPTV